MLQKYRSAVLGGALAALASGGAQAGGFYEVIPGELLDPRSGTFEFWHLEERNDARTQATEGALTFRRNAMRQYRLELGTEGTQEADSASAAGLEIVQLFREIDTHGYGLGLAVGVDYTITEYERADTFALVPLSVEWGQRGMITLNAGVVRNEKSEYERIRGIAVERDFFQRWSWVLEYWDDERGTPEEARAGLQLHLMDDLMTVDVAYGTTLESDNDDEYYIGLTFDAIRF